MKSTLFLVVLALTPLSAEALYSVSGKITTLYIRNSPSAVPAPAQGIMIGFSPGLLLPAGTASVPYCMSTTNPSTTAGIPKADPANPNADNPLYRELLNSATLALAMDKNVTIYFHDSLCYGVYYPTIIGIDVLP
jgi:hypothetical protein